jgi:phosphate transport system protein
VREAYHEQLAAVMARQVEMTSAVGEAVRTATRALLEADVLLADRVIAADAALDAQRYALDADLIELLARQAPVAGDLREVVASLRISSELERMGDLAVHVAQVARMRYPEIAVPESLRSTFQSMGHVAEDMARLASDVIRGRDVEQAQQLSKTDDEMDRLHRSLFLVLLDGHWAHGVEPAIDIALLGRYYERFADHAVSIGGRVVYLVTGVYPHEHDS